MGYYTEVADMAETTKLYYTVVAWWDAIEVLIVTGATTAKVEAANTPSRTSKAPAADFAAVSTTQRVSSSAAPSGAQRELKRPRFDAVLV